jgi:hypothetical protein
MSLVGAQPVQAMPQPVAAEVRFSQNSSSDLAALHFSEYLRDYIQPLTAPSIPSLKDASLPETHQDGNFCTAWYADQRGQKVVPPIESDAPAIDLVRLTKFPDWNPLAHKGYVDAWVIDVGRMNHVCGDGLTSRANLPTGYFEHGAEIADLIRSAAGADKLHVRLEVVDQSKISFAGYLSKLNNEIERTGKRPDLVNLSVGFVVPLDQAWRFTPDHIKDTATNDEYRGVDKDLEQLERLARNTNGPVFISAGNSGKDTVSTYRFARGGNIVIVGANDATGARADYTSAGSYLQVNGDLESHPVCDGEAITGIRTDPGHHLLQFADKLRSFKFVNGHSLHDVQADDLALSRMHSALRSHSLSRWSMRDNRFDSYVFTGDQVAQLASSTSTSPISQWEHPPIEETATLEMQDQRLALIAEFLKSNEAAIDARSLFALVEKGGKGISEEIVGLYWNTPNGLSLSKSCDEASVYFPTGTSFSAPKAAYVFIEEYLAHHS